MSLWGRDVGLFPFFLLGSSVTGMLLCVGVKGRSELPEIVERYLAGEFQLNESIARSMGLEAINDNF